MTLRQKLDDMGACTDAIAWVGKRRNAQKAWDECPRGDWLLWYAALKGVDRKVLVLAACACARTALVHVPVGKDRPLRAIETAEAWARGEATIDQVRKAYAAAADAAAYAAYAAAAAARTKAHADMANIVRGFIPVVP